MKSHVEYLLSSFIIAYLENDMLGHSICLSRIRNLINSNEIEQNDLNIIYDFVLIGE